jgi:hypothetical protein
MFPRVICTTVLRLFHVIKKAYLFIESHKRYFLLKKQNKTKQKKSKYVTGQPDERFLSSESRIF